MVVYTDSDWAGCKSSRRSVSGGLLTLAGATIKGWSNRQSSVAMSSAEAEYYAATKAMSEALGVKSLMHEMGWDVGPIEVRVDASAAIGMLSRRGLGKTKHIQVRYLWVQEEVAMKQFFLKQVAGTENPADVLTKLRPACESFALLERVLVSAASYESSGRGGVSAESRHTRVQA